MHSITPGILAKLFGPSLFAVVAIGPFLLVSHNADGTPPAVIPQALTPEPALPLERYAEGVVHPSVVATHNLLLTHHLRIVYTSTCQRTMGETGGLCASFWPAVNVKSNLLLQTTRATQTSWLTSLLSWHHHHHHEAFYLGCIVFLGMYTQI